MERDEKAPFNYSNNYLYDLRGPRYELAKFEKGLITKKHPATEIEFGPHWAERQAIMGRARKYREGRPISREVLKMRI